VDGNAFSPDLAHHRRHRVPFRAALWQKGTCAATATPLMWARLKVNASAVK
jgi:hypothetical protein